MTRSIIPAIPTKVLGVQFRSRLEAKWALFFDKVGWPWAYEPFDLNGYIPDFILGKDLLVEIKPVLNDGTVLAAFEKIRLSGWTGESVVLGSMELEPEHEDSWCMGYIQERLYPVDYLQKVAIGYASAKSTKLDLGASEGSYAGRIHGEYDGNPLAHYEWMYARRVGQIALVREYTDQLHPEIFWREAGNEVQWRGVGA